MAAQPTRCASGGVRGDNQEDGHDAGHGFRITGTTIAEVYDNYADSYEDVIGKTRLRSFQRDVLAQFPQHGFTLDLGCGPGSVGMLIRQSLLNAPSTESKVYIHGVDISTRMLSSPWCVCYYDSTQQGFIQDIPIDPNASWLQHAVQPGASGSVSGPAVDHITCFGALHFLNPTQLEAVLSRMFILARRSVMFDIDDVCPVYMKRILETLGEGFRNYNHMAAYRQFGTPPGWAKVVEEEGVIYHSENAKVDVRGVLVRFERVE